MAQLFSFKNAFFPQERVGLDILSSMTQDISQGTQYLSEVMGYLSALHKKSKKKNTDQTEELKEKLSDLYDQLASLENDSTDHLYALLTQLRSSYVHPIPPEDILALGRNLNTTNELLNEIGTLLQIYNLTNLSHKAYELLDLIQRLAELAAQTIRTNKSDEIEDLWIEMLQLTKQANKIYLAYISDIMQNSKALTGLKERDIADRLHNACKQLNEFATTIGSIIVKES